MLQPHYIHLARSITVLRFNDKEEGGYCHKAGVHAFINTVGINTGDNTSKAIVQM